MVCVVLAQGGSTQCVCVHMCVFMMCVCGARAVCVRSYARLSQLPYLRCGVCVRPTGTFHDARTWLLRRYGGYASVSSVILSPNGVHVSAETGLPPLVQWQRLYSLCDQAPCVLLHVF